MDEVLHGYLQLLRLVIFALYHVAKHLVRYMSSVTPGTTQPTTEQRMYAIDIATETFRNYEEIVQARLQNFLMADTILFAGWAAVFAEDANRRGPEAVVLVVLAFLSALLGVFWGIVGLRQRRFLDLQMDIL